MGGSPTGFFKLNWDAALDMVHCQMGIGAITRDWEGKVSATLRMKRDLFPNPFLAEAIPALQATLFCKNLGFKNIIIEGDALQVVHGIQRSYELDTCTGMIMVDTKSILANFDNWSVQHVGRNKSKVAHALGKNTLGIRNKCHWFCLSQSAINPTENHFSLVIDHSSST